MKKYILSIILFTLLLLGINNVNASCYSEYGFNTTSNYDGTCSCETGYHFETNSFGNTSCVRNPTCTDLYGWNATSNYNGTCSCKSGYHFEERTYGELQECIKDATCIDIYGYGAKENYSGKCECKIGYVWGEKNGKDYCVNGNTACNEKYGFMSSYDSYSGKCECKIGYEFTKKIYGTGLECKSCSAKYGYNSSYNNYTKSCECKDGYTLKDGKCEEKHNSAYFFLVEYDDDENKAIVTSYTTQEKYLLKFRYNSKLYKVKDFIGKPIVINMGTDSTIDKYDTFILNNQTTTINIVIDIIDVEEVDDDFTFKSCQDIFGYNAEKTYDNKCMCKSGYKWNYNKTSCEKDSFNLFDSSSNNSTITSTPINNNLTSTTNNTICGKNSTSKEIGKCSCNVGYKWENENDAKNFNCILEPTIIENTEEEKVEEETLKINIRLKNTIDSFFIKLKNKYSTYDDEKELKSYTSLNEKINILLKKRLSKSNKEILGYLNLLIEKEIDKLNNKDDDILEMLDDLLGK